MTEEILNEEVEEVKEEVPCEETKAEAPKKEKKDCKKHKKEIEDSEYSVHKLLTLF